MKVARSPDTLSLPELKNVGCADLERFTGVWGRGAFWHPPLKEENSGISLLHSPFLSQIIPSANKAHFPFSFHSVTIIWLVKHWQDIVTLCYMNALARLCQAQ
jgi:hypothetical protein